ncbi:Gfo/Idh/MocA family protein [Clostridium oryzae]|uniref:Glucose--fructose oxidoreductase n=1 Tax=Clostridium oryzae TaxID=1450648 RepID=A0A1V4IIF7_9CLOT|nr:Gfo/Idh/MocA family oxidoreductase [Clostridium oryzae]OPJ59791.1 glucose--fructose oxidoreductase precursor [Clostridium oryzae]
MKKLGAAIVGCGNIYRNHGDALEGSDYAEIKAVVDIDSARVQKAANIYACDAYEDYRRMLEREDIDVVHICLPHYLHSKVAISAIESGKHVLTEKPMDINLTNSMSMIETARKYHKYLGVCFQNRYNNASQSAKEIILKRQLGELIGAKAFVAWNRDKIYYMSGEWRGKFKTEGGGVLINQAIHTIDLLQWLAGGVKAVKANVDTRLLQKVIEVEDTADATFIFNNGAAGIFYATNCYSSNSPIEIEMNFERGFLKFEDDKLYIIDEDGKRDITANSQTENASKKYWGAGHKRLIEAFYKAIIDKTNDYVDGEAGIKTMKIIEAIYRSSSMGRKIYLD